ncbi:uncharacterized protein YeaO (DUF488 family) [Paraperlucidibaca baekdonensis]|uniref:Uncharacterized protein YeaO (DUF488 family) n=1 Tax=Paraperlucidibaca baekdonensis TaxID=748120 RepID=A0A3E0H2Z2_9GAMM|nr:DUF488 family protein [Paraperlucidibaca baekdonensis]REH37679.1 uncharacterized protein YeaO (DUF488 family) [Paraperlucidibaca baekdonensis]
MVNIKRVYEPASPSDGRRIFVDRLWPRGVSKHDLIFDDWCKDAAPSPALRTWYGHREERFEAFSQRYRQELNAEPGHWMPILGFAQDGPITLIFAARNPATSHARVLADFLEEALDKQQDANSPVCYATQFPH